MRHRAHRRRRAASQAGSVEASKWILSLVVNARDVQSIQYQQIYGNMLASPLSRWASSLLSCLSCWFLFCRQPCEQCLYLQCYSTGSLLLAGRLSRMMCMRIYSGIWRSSHSCNRTCVARDSVVVRGQASCWLIIQLTRVHSPLVHKCHVRIYQSADRKCAESSGTTAATTARHKPSRQRLYRPNL